MLGRELFTELEAGAQDGAHLDHLTLHHRFAIAGGAELSEGLLLRRHQRLLLQQHRLL